MAVNTRSETSGPQRVFVDLEVLWKFQSVSLNCRDARWVSTRLAMGEKDMKR